MSRVVLPALLRALVATAALGQSSAATPDIASRIQAKAVLLVDANSGQVLFSRMPDAKYPPASTAKLLTALLVYERVGLRGNFTIAEADTRVEPSHVPLRPGETVTVRDMVRSLLIGSDNDTAMALARHVGGSAPRFINLMNTRAQQLGCSASRFKNPNGLPAAGQYTTCQDLMRIFDRVLAIPALREICQMRGFYLNTSAGKQWVKNHNRLLGQYAGMGPAKTGWTIASRHTYAAAANRGGVELRLTLLNSPDKWSDSRILFDYGFARTGVTAAPASAPSPPRRSTKDSAGS